MAKFRKKPAVIEAWQWRPSDLGADSPDWILAAIRTDELHPEMDGTLTIRTLEDGKDGRAKHVAEIHDWVIRGVAGELYACKPDIFEQTYEPA